MKTHISAMKLSYTALTLFLLLFVQFQATAQKKELKKARSYFDIGEYYLSVDYFNQAKELGAVLGLEDQKNIARSYYYLNDIYHAFEAFSSLENNLSGEDLFFYASTLHQFELYEDAIRWYEKSKLQGANSLHVNDLIGSCKWALNNQTFVDYRVNPCFPLATQGQSFGVQYYKDKVVYSSASEDSKNLDKNGHPFLNLYCSTLNDGDVLENTGQVFSENLVSPYHVGAIAFSPDQKYMYYTKSVIVGNSDRLKIFVVEFDGSDWVNDRPITINSDKYDCAHPAISPDGKYIYFVSNRADGFGGKDIYYAERKGPNSFGEVKNAGSNINTYGDEVYPVISWDNKLYFSSNGHYGFGGLDIFVADYVDNKWQNVRNMMKPFNSNRDDFCYVIDPNNPDKGFLSSNKYQEGFADVIFSVSKISDEEKNKPADEMPPMILDGLFFPEEEVLPPLTPMPEPIAAPEPEPVVVEPEPEPEPAPVVEEKKPKLVKTTVISTYDGSKIAQATVRIVDATTNEMIVSARTDEGGQVMMNIPGAYVGDDFEYQVSVTKEGFKEKSTLASLADLEQMFKEGIQMTPIFKDAALDDISGMSIKYGSDSNFDAEAMASLDKLAAYLQQNPNIVIKLNGHTEAKGNRYGNLSVSQKMADQAKKLLVARGVNPDQVIPRGYGERYLVNRCRRGIYCDKAQHAENRRIEVVVWKGK